jgi:hypothetical protein
MPITLQSTLTIIILRIITATQVCHPVYVLGDSDANKIKKYHHHFYPVKIRSEVFLNI